MDLYDYFEKNTAHRDIKLENIIRKTNGDYALIDFGLSCTSDNNGILRKIIVLLIMYYMFICSYKFLDEYLYRIESYFVELLIKYKYNENFSSVEKITTPSI